MNSDQKYRAWAEQKKQSELSPHFAKKLMNRIHQFERAKRRPLFDLQQLLEFVSVHPLAKAGLIAAGAVAGRPGVHLSLGASAQCDPVVLRHAVTLRRPVRERHPIAPKLEHTRRRGKGRRD